MPSTPLRPNRGGFSLLELLVGLALASLVIAAALYFFSNLKRTVTEESLAAEVENNARWGMSRLLDKVRYAGYGLPPANLAAWLPWVAGVSAKVQVIESAGVPDTLQVAQCTSVPLTTLASDASFSSAPPTVTLADAAPFDNANRRLMVLDNQIPVHVQTVSGNSVTLDADPLTAGAQAPRPLPQGTPACRVDVLTFGVDVNRFELWVDANDGGGRQVMLSGVEDLQIDTLAAGERYRLTLAVRSSEPLPSGGPFLRRRLSTEITLRNQ